MLLSLRWRQVCESLNHFRSYSRQVGPCQDTRRVLRHPRYRIEVRAVKSIHRYDLEQAGVGLEIRAAVGKQSQRLVRETPLLEAFMQAVRGLDLAHREERPGPFVPPCRWFTPDAGTNLTGYSTWLRR